MLEASAHTGVSRPSKPNTRGSRLVAFATKITIHSLQSLGAKLCRFVLFSWQMFMRRPRAESKISFDSGFSTDLT